MNTNWIVYLGTYPPRQCGIATFTKDLTTAIDKKFLPSLKSKIIAMNDPNRNYNYSDDVIYSINELDQRSYLKIAKKINYSNQIKAVNIQHEFGIFGGYYGEYLIPFIENLRKPIITTLHSIIPNPDLKIKGILRKIAEISNYLVIMNKLGIDILKKDYNISHNIVYIPHGAPTVPFNEGLPIKRAMGFENKILLSSFGLLNSGKGYEYVIEALPDIVNIYPNLLYLIMGETHPVVQKHEGERYRNFLKGKVKELNLEKNVKFINKYVSLKEIVRLLQASDIFISANQDPRQIVSGTLAYAAACGKAIISTPYLHAKDLLSSNRGVLAEFKDSNTFKKGILKLIKNKNLKSKIEIRMYAYTRNTIWPNVAISYFNIFKNVSKELKECRYSVPEIKLKHIKKLTDNFGLLQFSRYAKPDKLSGYTADDNARALLACCIYYNIFKEKEVLKLIEKYLNVIDYLKNDYKFYNIVNPIKKVVSESWSEDAHGRTLWALGYIIQSPSLPQNIKKRANFLFKKGLIALLYIKSPRAIAFIIIGLYYHNQNFTKHIRKLSDYLISLYNQHSDKNWHWFEKFLTYSNSKLPEALLYGYKSTKNKKYLKIAQITLDFLIDKTFYNGFFSPIGQNGWYFKNNKKALYDQQPVEAGSMVQTLILAYQITNEERYLDLAIKTFEWYLGRNSIKRVVYDDTLCGCYDGLGENSINLNLGAESTVTYLLARLSLEELKISDI
ncbi:MAG: glycosyltransferase [Candidatus Thorarchaeota archaeon]